MCSQRKKMLILASRCLDKLCNTNNGGWRCGNYITEWTPKVKLACLNLYTPHVVVHWGKYDSSRSYSKSNSTVVTRDIAKSSFCIRPVRLFPWLVSPLFLMSAVQTFTQSSITHFRKKISIFDFSSQERKTKTTVFERSISNLKRVGI